MSEYFAKILPIEGKIKKGDTWGFTYKGKWTVSSYKANDWDEDDKKAGIPQYDPECVNPKKAMLFICESLMKVGSEVQRLGHGPFKIIKEINHKEEWLTLEDDKETYYSGDFTSKDFNIIGKVSPDAGWVKEKMEFNENELFRCFIGHALFDGTVKLKGPCGHFH